MRTSAIVALLATLATAEHAGLRSSTSTVHAQRGTQRLQTKMLSAKQTTTVQQLTARYNCHTEGETLEQTLASIKSQNEDANKKVQLQCSKNHDSMQKKWSVTTSTFKQTCPEKLQEETKYSAVEKKSIDAYFKAVALADVVRARANKEMQKAHKQISESYEILLSSNKDIHEADKMLAEAKKIYDTSAKKAGEARTVQSKKNKQLAAGKTKHEASLRMLNLKCTKQVDDLEYEARTVQALQDYLSKLTVINKDPTEQSMAKEDQVLHDTLKHEDEQVKSKHQQASDAINAGLDEDALLGREKLGNAIDHTVDQVDDEKSFIDTGDIDAATGTAKDDGDHPDPDFSGKDRDSFTDTGGDEDYPGPLFGTTYRDNFIDTGDIDAATGTGTANDDSFPYRYTDTGTKVPLKKGFPVKSPESLD